MADLNIRNVDVTLVTSCKLKALSCGQTLREWVLLILEEAIDVDGRGAGFEQAGPVERAGGRVTVPDVRKAEGDPELLRLVQSMRPELGGRGGSIGSSAHETCKTKSYKDGKRWCEDHQRYYRV